MGWKGGQYQQQQCSQYPIPLPGSILICISKVAGAGVSKPSMEVMLGQENNIPKEPLGLLPCRSSAAMYAGRIWVGLGYYSV